MKVGVIGVGSMGMNHARVYSEIADLLGMVDALSIATPTNQHYPIAMDAIANGKHLLIEKPIASTVEEGEKMIDKAKEQGIVLAVGHIERHNPAIRYVKKALKDDKFGKMFSLSGKRLGLYQPRIRDVGVIHNHFLMLLIGKNSMKMFL